MSNGTEGEIDRELFVFSVRYFWDCHTEAELLRIGEMLKHDETVNEATRAALRPEYGRNLRRLRAAAKAKPRHAEPPQEFYPGEFIDEMPPDSFYGA